MKKPLPLDENLAIEAKTLTALAFRNGPIEDVHAGQECPVCIGKDEYSRITQEEMKTIMKSAVDTLYALLWMKEYSPDAYDHVIRAGYNYAREWDMPEDSRAKIDSFGRFADRYTQGA